MTALDTNVLLRFLVGDDEAQSQRAHLLVAQAVAAGESLFVSEVVLCEVVWVLGRGYRHPKDVIVKTLRSLLQAAEINIQERHRVRRAVEVWSRGAGDFSDYLIRELGRDFGCDRVATFDKALLAEPGFFSP